MITKRKRKFTETESKTLPGELWAHVSSFLSVTDVVVLHMSQIPNVDMEQSWHSVTERESKRLELHEYDDFGLIELLGPPREERDHAIRLSDLERCTGCALLKYGHETRICCSLVACTGCSWDCGTCDAIVCPKSLYCSACDNSFCAVCAPSLCVPCPVCAHELDHTI